MSLTNGSWKGLRSSKRTAILGSTAASFTLGLAFLESDLSPFNVPDASVVAALYLQPALFMILPRRRASLDLAAGIIGAFLGVGFFLIPYALVVPEFLMAGLFTITSAVAAFIHNSLAPETKGDGRVAFLAVLLIGSALIASRIGAHPMCRTSPMESVCVDDATSYIGAAAAVVTLWLGTALLWLAARKPLPTSPVTLKGGRP